MMFPPPQVLINGLIAGTAYALIALGFSLIYSTTKFFHFAHGAVYSASAYAAFGLIAFCSLPFSLSISAAILFGAVLGMVIERLVYRPLRTAGSPPLVIIIASFGVYIVLQNVISMIFGDGVKTLRRGSPHEGLLLWGSRLTVPQLVSILTTVSLFAGTYVIVRYSRIGKILRAVANDPDLARVNGIETDRVIMCAFAAGSVLAAVAAILVSFDTDISPTMGMSALLMGVVATIVGGIGSIRGALLGGLFVGIIQHLGAWKLPAQWQDTIVFSILILFLLARPQGILGKPLRTASL